MKSKKPITWLDFMSILNLFASEGPLIELLYDWVVCQTNLYAWIKNYGNTTVCFSASFGVRQMPKPGLTTTDHYRLLSA